MAEKQTEVHLYPGHRVKSPLRTGIKYICHGTLTQDDNGDFIVLATNADSIDKFTDKN